MTSTVPIKWVYPNGSSVTFWVPESTRSAARRQAGRALEQAHPGLVRQLRNMNDAMEKQAVKHGANPTPKYYARRTEWVRSDLAATYPDEYRTYMKNALQDMGVDFNAKR